LWNYLSGDSAAIDDGGSHLSPEMLVRLCECDGGHGINKI